MRYWSNTCRGDCGIGRLFPVSFHGSICIIISEECPVEHVLPVASNLEPNVFMHVHVHIEGSFRVHICTHIKKLIPSTSVELKRLVDNTQQLFGYNQKCIPLNKIVSTSMNVCGLILSHDWLSMDFKKQKHPSFMKPFTRFIDMKCCRLNCILTFSELSALFVSIHKFSIITSTFIRLYLITQHTKVVLVIKPKSVQYVTKCSF